MTSPARTRAMRVNKGPTTSKITTAARMTVCKVRPVPGRPEPGLDGRRGAGGSRSQPAADILPRAAQHHIRRADQAHLAQVFEMQGRAGHDEKEHIQGIVDGRKVLEDPLAVRRGVHRHQSRNQDGKHGRKLKTRGQAGGDGNRGQHHDLPLYPTGQTLVHEGNAQAQCAPQDKRRAQPAAFGQQ